MNEVAEMRTIYLDPDFKCRVADGGTGKAVETDYFDGKCDEFIEGYRFVPAGESWVRGDGTAFRGEMIAPWKDHARLDDAQRTYEQQLLEEYEMLINTLYEEVQ